MIQNHHNLFQGIRSREIWNLLVLLTVICYVSSNASVILPGVHRNSHGRAEAEKISPSPKNLNQDYSCYDVFGKAFVGSIPHPSNCNFYIMCVERNGQPVPNLTKCPTDQVFDLSIDFCQCREPDGNEVCFDLQNPEHEPIRFQCAQPAFSRRTVLKF